ncbi:MAG: aminotransferase class I/II-fold pyridoxal phosphate-dependent enzyme [Armatimonadota bacterium]
MKRPEHVPIQPARRIREMPPSGIRKFFDLVSQMDGVISLGVGEPDFVTPWRIREAAIYATERGATSYTSNYGLPELRRYIAQHLESTWGVKYDPTCEILVTVGVSEAVDLAARAMLEPGDEVLIPEPCYVSYKPCVELAGGVGVSIPCRPERGFHVDVEDLRSAITPKTKAILFNYPNNPTGASLTRRELEAIAELAREHNLLVISDEIYAKLTYDMKHTCFASLPDMRSRTILLNGFSKAYAMTGWRVGYAAAPAPIIDAMCKIHQYTILCAGSVPQHAAIEALRNGDFEADLMADSYNHRRRLIVKGLNRIGLPCHLPEGAFYAFPSIKHTGMTSEEFAERLLMEERVAVVPGSAFGQSGEGYIRCAYAASVQDITEALERMSRFLKRHACTAGAVEAA